MRLLRRRGDRVVITTRECAGYNGTVEANVYRLTVDYPYEFTNGFHIIRSLATRVHQLNRATFIIIVVEILRRS